MYEFPDHFDGKQFVGKDVQQLCFAAYSYYLHFEGDHLLIRVEGPSKHWHEGKQDHIAFPVQDSELVRLIGTSVTRAEVATGGNLTLTFSNRDTLMLEGDNGPYESFHIKAGQMELTI